MQEEPVERNIIELKRYHWKSSGPIKYYTSVVSGAK